MNHLVIAVAALPLLLTGCGAPAADNHRLQQSSIHVTGHPIVESTAATQGRFHESYEPHGD